MNNRVLGFLALSVGLLIGCASSDRSRGVGATSNVQALTYTPLSHLIGEFRLPYQSGAHEYPTNMTPNGGFMGTGAEEGEFDGAYALAWIDPVEELVSVAVVSGLGHPGGPGELLATEALNTPSAVGVAATEFTDSTGGTSVVFAYVDPDEDRVFVFEVDRETATVTEPVSVYASSFGGEVMPVSPALEVGRNEEGEERVFLAFASVGGFLPVVKYGSPFRDLRG